MGQSHAGLSGIRLAAISPTRGDGILWAVNEGVHRGPMSEVGRSPPSASPAKHVRVTTERRSPKVLETKAPTLFLALL